MTNLFPNSLTPHTVSPLPFPSHNLIPTASLCKECIAQVLKYLIRAGQSGRGGESAKKGNEISFIKVTDPNRINQWPRVTKYA